MPVINFFSRILSTASNYFLCNIQRFFFRTRHINRGSNTFTPKLFEHQSISSKKSRFTLEIRLPFDEKPLNIHAYMRE